MINEIEYSKVMKNNPSVAEKGSPSKWARMTRHAVACGAAMLLSLSSAVAQSIAISTVAGSYPAISSGSIDGAGTAARFNNPQGVAVDSANGIVYIADAANHKIRKYVISTGQVTTIAGTGASGSADNPAGTSASFNTPQGVALDSTGANLYVADTFNQVIRKIVLTSPFAVTTIAGTVSSAGAVDNASGLSAKFQSPRGVVVDGTNVYVADTGNNSIRLVATGTVGNPVSTFAGDTAGASGVLNGVGTAARFNQPFAITSDGTNLYVADTNNHAVRQIVLTGGVVGTVSTLAGSIGVSGSTDSIGTSASFKNPTGITVKLGTVYVSDTLNNTIRQIVISSGAVSTLAGTAGQSGLFDGLSTAARFQGPAGIGIDGSNNLYIADTSNQTIRRGGAATIPTVTTPTTAPVAVGVAATFTVTVGGNPTPTIQWQRQLASGGSFFNLSNDSTYSGVFTTTLTVTNPQAAMNGDKFQAVVTNGVSPTPSVTSASATLVVQQAPTITNVSSASFPVGSASTFQFVATGSPAPTFSIVSGTSPGSLNTTTGLYSYTPLNNSGSPFTFVVKADNGVGTAATQTFTLTIQNGAGIATQPVNAVVSPGGTASFSVVASGTPSTFTYQWYRSAGGVGGFFPMTDIAGTYSGTNSATLAVFNATQGMSGDQFQVLVSNGIGSSTSLPATLTVAIQPVFTSLNNTIFALNQLNNFTVQATGSPAPTFSFVAGTQPTTWSLSLNPTTGLLSGTPINDTGSPFSFTIRASNGIGSVDQNFTLSVTPSGAFPAITTQPISVSAAIGQPVTFTVVVTGSPAPVLQWQRQPITGGGFFAIPEGGGFSGTTTGTLTIANATTAMNGDQYQCVAANVVNSLPATATSNIATLTVSIGTIITTVAGTPGQSATVDGTGLSAQFSNPYSLAVDLAGNIYVADPTAHVIRKITAAGVVTTFAGTPGSAGSADGLGSAARFNGPSGVAVDGSGNVYVADTNNHTIRGISLNGNVFTLAGTAGATGSVDGVGAAARFTYPFGLAVDSFGSIYVADTFNGSIRKINQSASNTVTTYAGVSGQFGTADGAGLTVARFNQPNGVAVDSTGVVYVADTFSHTIRRISTLQEVTTIAGLPGTVGSLDGTGSAARFNQPNGISVDSAGNLYIADSQNRTIRRSGAVTGAVITTQPTNASAAPGSNATFTVVATGSPLPATYQWQRKPADASTDFVNLPNDSVYNGSNSATLTVVGITAAMNNDQFRVIVSNFISPDATSNAVTLSTVVTAPVFTSIASTSFKATELGAFTVAATGNPVPTYSATGLPTWLTLNATTGVLSGTAPDTVGSPFTLTITATNGVPVNQTFTLTVTPAVVAPAIVNQPVGGALNRGQNAVFSVTVTGTTPLVYQWNKDGLPLAGATTSTLTLNGVQTINAGAYTVTVSNAGGTVTSNAATLSINAPPVIVSQPQAQTALVGSTVTFSVVATGTPTPFYQWRANGQTIVGATSPTLTLTNVQNVNAANYDVLVNNGVGGGVSSLAQLTIVTAATAPVITSSPAPRTAVVGSSTVLSVGVSAAPAPTSYQWRKGGVALAGANSPTLTLANLQLGDSANYDVIVTNSAGSATSSPAAVTVVRRSFAGAYFGTLGSGLGNFAFYVRGDNTGLFLAYVPGSNAGVRFSDFSVADNGLFNFFQGALSISGVISDTGVVTGSAIGVINAPLSGAKSAESGSSAGLAGIYQAGAANTSSTAYAVVGSAGQAFVLVQTSATTDGGPGVLDGNNRITISTARQSIIATITPDTSLLSVVVTSGTASVSYAGAGESVLASQRLANISSRAMVGSGNAVTIAGFVISGQDSKPVLIRAIGPTLGSLGVATALAQPKLELFRANGTLITSNTGWTTSGNTSAIEAATIRAGAFALGANAADSVILATLAPGAYTAVISSANANSGVALAEVYDLSAAAAGQKLFNISTRANTGTGDSILTAGVVVSGAAPKRVLIRGVGPTLTSLGVTGALAQPQLTVIKDGTTVASNVNWSTSPDASAIASAATQVGAFALGASSADAAMIVSLTPGNYSVQLTGVGGTAGIAIIEVYELP